MIATIAMTCVCGEFACGQASDGPVTLADRIELSRLLDLASKRLDLSIEYDSKALSAITVELRLDQSLTDERLWTLTNQLLATRGFTTICTSSQPPAAAQDDHQANGQQAVPNAPVISVVKLSEAASLARIERDVPLQTDAGFVSVWLQVRHRPLKDISDAVKAIMSKPGGAVQDLVSQGALIVSDLRPRAEQMIAIVQAMDEPGEGSVVETIEALNLRATTLVAVVTAAGISSSAMSSRPLQGKVTATPDDRALVVVAPAHELPRWRELIAQFDRPVLVETRTYAPKSFALSDVANLIEQTARDSSGAQGSGERWRMVHDSLGSLLVVTATIHEHEQIAALVERLNGLPFEVRRPVRAFPIRNRGVNDIVEVLDRMLATGVLDARRAGTIGDTPESSGTSESGPRQRSERSVDARTDNGKIKDPPVAGASQPDARGGAASAQQPISASSHDHAQNAPVLTLTSDEGTNTLIAVGEPRNLDQLQELLRVLDVRQPQVMVEVLVVSLSESDTLDLGVELEKIEVSGDTVITLSSLFGLMPRGATSPTGKGFSGLVLNPGDFRILIRALQTLNNGRALNMPRVLVNNNQQANLDSVVQQPFVSTNASDTVATTSFGGFENAGTTITVKPLIAKGDHLVLEYAVSLSAFVGESSDPGVPPPRQQNNLQSVVTVPDGYTVVVGGIENEIYADAVSQVPLLGDVPIIGEAFKSRSRSSSRSRFFVFIRPTVLRQERFEDLKYLSDVATSAAEVADRFPKVEPRIIR